MYSLNFPTKDPDERLDYGFDWSARLTQGDTIIQHDLTVVEGSLTVSSSTHTTLAVNFWATGGAEGESSTLLCRVTTALGRVMDQTATLYVVTR